MTSVQNIFESIKQTNQYKAEYWSARDLAKILGYVDYRNFQEVVKKAQESCKNAGQSIKDHFGEVTEMINLGKSASREVKNTYLSRYACYLILQNADPAKEIVALGQTYFAIQTRRQEVQEQFLEDQKRLAFRQDISVRNKHLSQTASRSGIENYAIFTNYGYKGLYGGLDVQHIHTRKKLKKSQKILDYMGSEELAANIFRATQAEAKLRRENIQGQIHADQTHFEVGREVRQTIKKLGGTMPENLPTPESITQTKKRIKKSTPKLEIHD